MNYNTQTTNQTSLLYSFKFWLLTFLLILFYSAILISQNVVYIDPTFTGPDQTGTLAQPFSNWDNDITWQNNTTYLQKRGTSILNTSPLIIQFKENITIGAYGEGTKPTIRYLGSNSDVINISCSSHCTIEGLALVGNIYDTRAGIHVSGFWWANGEVANDTKIVDCDISNVYNGVRALKYQTNIDTIGIYNCNIFDCMSDGIFLIDMDSINVINTHIWNINMGWHLLEGGHSQNVSGGDCIQIGGDSHSFTVRNCILDRRETGNKFCLIYNTGGDLLTGRGLVEWNTFYPPKDTIGDDGGSCMYLKWGEKVAIRHNKYIARGYPGGGETGVSLAHFEVDSIEFAYNMIDNVDYANFTLPVDYATICNNTFVKATGTNRMIYLNGTNCLAQNNVFALNTGMTAIYNNNGSLTEINDHIVYGNSSNWNVDPGFVDWQIQNFRLNETSPCTNGGNNYNDYIFDLDSISVPQAGIRDIGAFEYTDGSQSTNSAPLINNQQFNLPENTASGVFVATVVASDPDVGQTLSFSIIAGNVDNAFVINPVTGDLSVDNATALNFEQTASFSLTVLVQDNAASPLSSSATITVDLTDVNENPGLLSQGFNLDENTMNGVWVGQVVADDPDNGQSLIFSIQSGNTDNAFVLNNSTGEITVNNEQAVNFELNPVFDLTVRATDNGTGNLWTEAQVLIYLFDVNEAPMINSLELSVDINGLLFISGTQNNQIFVGDILAIDPDAGQELTYQIIKCNDNDLWGLDEITGELNILDPSKLNPVEINNYFMTIEVSDDNVSPLSATAEIVIHVNISNADAFGDYIDNLLSGISNPVVDNTLSILPNPASEQIRITMNRITQAPVNISIFSINGNCVLNKNFEFSSESFNEAISLNQLEKGLYMVCVQQGENLQSTKLIKQ